MSQEDFNTSDRLTYSESRTINMGDYESTQSFFSFGTSISHRIGGKKSAKIQESATSSLMKKTPEEFTKVAKRLVRKVKHVLDEQELIVRKTCIVQKFNEEDEMFNKYNHLLKKKKEELANDKK